MPGPCLRRRTLVPTGCSILPGKSTQLRDEIVMQCLMIVLLFFMYLCRALGVEYPNLVQHTVDELSSFLNSIYDPHRIAVVAFYSEVGVQIKDSSWPKQFVICLIDFISMCCFSVSFSQPSSDNPCSLSLDDIYCRHRSAGSR